MPAEESSSWPCEDPEAHRAAYHDPDVQGDAEGEVHRGQHDGAFELVEQEADQAGLEDERVEEQEEDDDDVEEDRDVLDAAGQHNKAQHRAAEDCERALVPRAT